MVLEGSIAAGASLVFGVFNVIYEIDMVRHQSTGMLFLLEEVIAGYGAIIGKIRPQTINITQAALWLSGGALTMVIAWIALLFSLNARICSKIS